MIANMYIRLGAPVFMVTALAVSGVVPRLPRAVGIAGATEVATFQAEGIQIYECKTGRNGKLSWAFREPIAALLFDGRTVGRHYAGPTWESLDGSIVTGKIVASSRGATRDDMDWLALEVVNYLGGGTLANVTTVLCLDTHGGAAQGSCETAGGLRSVPYSATYVFLRADSLTHGSVYIR